MFSNREIKKLKDKVNSIPSLGAVAVPGEPADGDLVAKITASTLDSTDLVYNYTWQAIKSDGTNDTAEGGTSTARCIQEKGQNMTGKSATAPNDSVVYIRIDDGGYTFSYGGGSSVGSTSPDNALGNSWTRDGSASTDSQAYHYDVISDVVVDYNQNQCYAVVVTEHVDSKGAVFQEVKSTKVLFNLIAINN